MKREYAEEVYKAVDSINCFEVFMDILDGAINQGIDICGMSESDDFIIELRELADDELERRKSVLEEL